jgi:glycosyltransferase involved in cell wall biosynthesis
VERVSCAVVIPAWNAARYIAEAIESVLAQTVAAATIVVVDDGSTDDTGALVRAYPNVRLVEQTHAGAAAARNRAVAACDEPLLAFLDADDVWERDKLECQLDLLAAPGVDAVFGVVENFISPDRASELAHLDLRSGPQRGPGLSALVVRRETFERVGPFAAGEVADWVDWYLRLIDSGAVIELVDRVVVRRRIHGDNHTMQASTDMAAYVRLVKAYLDRRKARTPSAVPVSGA